MVKKMSARATKGIEVMWALGNDFFLYLPHPDSEDGMSHGDDAGALDVIHPISFPSIVVRNIPELSHIW
jgi:hypothetical protein